MARRRAPLAPSREAQHRAFYKASGGKHHRTLRPGPPTLHSGLVWLLENELAASREEETRREGAPAKVARLIPATIWLEHFGIGLTDTRTSRCVRALTRFLEHEAAGSPGGSGPKAQGTAEQLAGTLLAYTRSLKLTSYELNRPTTSANTRYAAHVEGCALWLRDNLLQEDHYITVLSPEEVERYTENPPVVLIESSGLVERLRIPNFFPRPEGAPSLPIPTSPQLSPKP
jgi:hypothetical protein